MKALSAVVDPVRRMRVRARSHIIHHESPLGCLARPMQYECDAEERIGKPAGVEIVERDRSRGTFEGTEVRESE